MSDDDKSEILYRLSWADVEAMTEQTLSAEEVAEFVAMFTGDGELLDLVIDAVRVIKRREDE